MILIIGEILVDVFKDGSIEEVRPGGAPFNVASNIAFFGGDVIFNGVVGNDKYGEQLIDFASRQNFKKTFIKKMNNLKTTIALVNLDKGERSFKFIREDGADYQFDLNELIENVNLNEVDIVHFGSLCLSSEKGRDFIKNAIDYFKGFPHIKISFDVNYRSDIFFDTNQSKQYYIDVIKKCDLIKVSEEEVLLLSNVKKYEEGLKYLFNKNQYVFVSLGKLGSALYHDDKLIKVDSIKVDALDTTGAGDAFYSFILYEVDNNKNALKNEENIRDLLRFANIVGAKATTKKGAIGVVPPLEEVIGVNKK